MRIRTISFLAIVLTVTLVGCEQPQAASDGAVSVALAPVGPVPGAGAGPPAPANPYAHDALAMAQGRKLFIWYNCYSCHGGHGGGAIGPSLRDPAWIYGSRAADIFHSISQGRGKGMPAWGLKIPQQQIWELVAYIKSMGSPQEPDPPR